MNVVFVMVMVLQIVHVIVMVMCLMNVGFVMVSELTIIAGQRVQGLFVMNLVVCRVVQFPMRVIIILMLSKMMEVVYGLLRVMIVKTIA